MKEIHLLKKRQKAVTKIKKQSFFVVNYSSYEDELYCNAEIFTNNYDAVKRFKELVSQIQQEGLERDFYYVPQCEPDDVVYRAYDDCGVELMVQIDKVEVNN